MKQTLIGRFIVCSVVFLFIGGASAFSSSMIRQSPSSIQSNQVLYVGGSGPGNYSTIQAAVDNASAGDTVFVYDDSAPYYESVSIKVPIQLLGENRNTTSIEGGNHAISIFVDGVTVSGFRISNVGDFWNCCGFYVTSQGNNISGNNIINNLRMNGVFLDGGSYNTISRNLIENNRYHGIRVEFSSHNMIAHNVIVNNRGYGIYLHEATENVLVGNTIKKSYFEGVMLGEHSTNNVIYHNNIIDNPANAFDETGNIWDTGESGNYWSDYTGSDNDGDGIGDDPYQIPGGASQDRYPLMSPYEFQAPAIEITISGGTGIAVSVKNVGLEDVLHIDWESCLTGGVVLLPSQRKYQGSVIFLATGQELVLQRIGPLVGVGRVMMTVSVGRTSESVKGFLLFFFFVPHPG